MTQNKVNLSFLGGVDGNAFSILGAWRRAARKADWSPVDIDKVINDATSGDYDHLLQTIMKTGN